MFVICIVDLRTKKMNGINPGEMAGFLDAVGFQGGNLSMSISTPEIKPSSMEILQDFNKQELLERVSKFTLSDDVKYFVEGYERIFGERDVFLWKFLGTVHKEAGVRLSTVNNGYIDSITDNKILISILCCILDDVIDVHKDKELFNAMIELMNKGTIEEEFKQNVKILYLEKLWNYLINELSKYPRYEEFKDIFMFDFKQFLNNFEYSYLVNNHPMYINLNDMDNYSCHNMMVYLYNGIDLFASTEDLKNEDLPHLRTAFWHAQQMARIGNWLTTWKRELKERDISSGVFSYSFSNKIIDIDDIGKLPDDEIIYRIENSGMYEYFMSIWSKNYAKLVSLKDKIQSVDMDAYVNGLENVIKFHMASEGLK